MVRAWKLALGLLVICAAVDAAPPSPDEDVVELALRATRCAESQGLLSRPELVTIIDYSRPSTDTRLWVLEPSTRRVRYYELVTHGRGTGEHVAERFSNRPGSHQSSLGLFVTGKPYRGRNGYSLRLDGLETGVNHRARERAIVMHGAP